MMAYPRLLKVCPQSARRWWRIHEKVAIRRRPELVTTYATQRGQPAPPPGVDEKEAFTNSIRWNTGLVNITARHPRK